MLGQLITVVLIQVGIGWSESDLVEFMGTTLPEKLKPDLTRAGPLLYRCIQRLGAFPWHNQPLQEYDLGFESLVIAIVILLRRYDTNVRPFFFITNSGLGDSHDDESCQQEDGLHRLLFQCMSVASETLKQLDVEGLATDDTSYVFDGDDFYLLQAHALVVDCNRQRSEFDEKYMTKGPPVMDVTALPSSKSQDSRVFVSKDEFRSLLNILLASQLYLLGYGPERLSLEGDTMDRVTSTVSNIFSKFENEAGIT
jgi:hypothetical protein